jgi:hypothetical protein
MGRFDFLPTMAEVAAMRAGKPIPKGKTRLQEKVEARPLVKVTEKDFKQEVWTRDKSRCRCCGRKVQKIMGRVPERGEVHHIHGRTGDLRFEAKAALLLCLACHERVTGKVNQKLVVVPSTTFTMRQGTFTDARHPVKFQEV